MKKLTMVSDIKGNVAFIMIEPGRDGKFRVGRKWIMKLFRISNGELWGLR